MDPAVSIPAAMAALPPTSVQLPPHIDLLVQAARAGRLESLKRLHEAGRFLDLYSPHRPAAGEARRAEAWLAALAACKAGRANVLILLFREGWPTSINAEPPWHLRDVAGSWIKQFGTIPKQRFVDPLPDIGPRWRQPELPCFLPEVELYRCAMRAPACLHALLDAGARSGWICRAAVLEGRADLLGFAVALGCPCDAECLFSAARMGQVEVLEVILKLGLDSILETTNRLLPNDEGAFPGTRTTANLVQQAGMEAAARGQKACLEALLRWHPDLLCSSSAVPQVAAREGNLRILHLLLYRRGAPDWDGTTRAAARKPDNLLCLQFLFHADPPQRYWWHPASFHPMDEAARAGSLANLKALHEAGCQWTGNELVLAINSGNLNVVKFCLEHVAEFVENREFDWHCAMKKATLVRRSPEIMQMLYNAGFPRGGMEGERHPVVLAIAAGILEGTQIAVKYSGLPDLQWLDTKVAAGGGEALLRYVHELCGTLHPRTADAAARSGQLGALRYAIESRGPWDQCTLMEAVQGDSLDCLRYAHEGCLHLAPGQPLIFPSARSLPVLRYVCDHMGPTWSAGVVRATAMKLACSIRQVKTAAGLDWQMALYTVQQFLRSWQPRMLWEDLPAVLAGAVQERIERAGALAGAFFKAGQLGRAQVARSWVRVWRSMAGVPWELRETIAFMAHLVPAAF